MTSRYDLLGKIHWQMTGTPSAPICPERANPLIAQLTQKLQNYIFEGNGIKAPLIDLDDPWNIWHNKYFLEGGWSICRFDVMDSAKADDIRCQNFNNFIRGAIARDLLSWKLKHYKTELRVIGVIIP